MKGITIKVINGLIKRDLPEEFINIYEQTNSRLNNKERKQFINLITTSSKEKIAEMIVKKAVEKRILIKDEAEEETKKERVKETKEDINKRQKKFLERKKQEGAKKIQVYIPEDTQIKFKKLQNKFGLTQAELIIKLIDEKYAQI